jgi:hypothetical protein
MLSQTTCSHRDGTIFADDPAAPGPLQRRASQSRGSKNVRVTRSRVMNLTWIQHPMVSGRCRSIFPSFFLLTEAYSLGFMTTEMH